MKPSKKCPVIRDIENKYAKKCSASTLRVAYAKEMPGVSVKRKVITNRQREQWLKKVKASQMKYLSDTDKKNVGKGLVMWKDCVVIPEDDDDLVKEVLSDAHNNAFAGHVGITKMVEHLHEKSIHIKNARTHAKRFINSCGICQKMKARQLVRMMMKTTTVSYPFDTVAVDTVGPIMPSKAKARYLVVM
ncbi:hypothetical protein ADUPG1_004406, partial [Aduncisulcus paluster]